MVAGWVYVMGKWSNSGNDMDGKCPRVVVQMSSQHEKEIIRRPKGVG